MEAQKKAIIKGLESNLRSQSKLYNSAVQSRKKAETLMVESKKTLSVSDKNLLCAASKSYNAMFQNLKLAKASENEELQKLKDVGKQLTLAKKELELINHFGFGAKILVEDSEIGSLQFYFILIYDFLSEGLCNGS